MTSWAKGFGPYTQPGAYRENIFGTNMLSGLLNPQQANQPANGNVGMNTAMAPNMGQVNEVNDYFGSYGKLTEQDIQRQNMLRGLLEAYM